MDSRRGAIEDILGWICSQKYIGRVWEIYVDGGGLCLWEDYFDRWGII